MSFSQYARARRLGHAFNTIRKGNAVIEAQLDAGFESGSGFREAFSRTFGEAPNKSRKALTFAMDWIDTPLGPMFAVADDTHLHTPRSRGWSIAKAPGLPTGKTR